MTFHYILILPNNTTLRVQDTQAHTHDNRYRIDRPPPQQWPLKMYSHGWDNMAFKILVDYLPYL